MSRGEVTALPLSPVFKRRITSFSQAQVESKDLLLYHFKESITCSLTCAGMDQIQVSNILAQIDFCLTDAQHEHLHHAKILHPENAASLKNIVKQTTALLDSQAETKAIIKIQSHARRWLVRKRLNKLNKEETGMLRIRSSNFVELLRYEKKFVESLQTIVNIYIKPLKQNASKFNLGEAAVNYLAGNTEELLVFHQQFYERLENVRNHHLYPVVLKIGDLMNEESAELRAVHMSFTNNYVACIETLRYLQSTIPRFQTFISEKSANGLQLADLLDVPLQYLPAMSKRLRSIHSISFDAIEPERAQLARIIGIIESIDVAAQKILDEQLAPQSNEAIKQILVVELTIEGLQHPLLGTPNRKLLKEGPVRLSKKKNAHQLYLFNDIIIMAEKIVNTTKFKLLRRIYSNELTIEEQGTKLKLQITSSPTKKDTETLLFKNSKQEKAEWCAALNSFVETYRKNCVYGTPLDEIIVREEIPEKIPFVIVICTKYIREYGRATEGIFRVPGKGFEVDTFQRLFDSGATEVDFRGCSVHDVATLLKLYLRMLPEPLIPFKSYPKLIATQSTYENDNKESDYMLQTATFISELSVNNRRVFKYLLVFLKDLAEHAKHTKMTASNLALVFAPNIVRPEVDTVDTAMQSPIVTRILEYCIVNHEKLWAEATKQKVEIIYEAENGPSAIDKKKLLQKVTSRYSMDAFDPLLCGEIPLPGTLDKPKRRGVLAKSPGFMFDTLRTVTSPRSNPTSPKSKDDNNSSGKGHRKHK